MDPKQDKVRNEGAENASSEEIRSDIKGTRREMDETLDELGERLHPRHLLDEVIDIFRRSRCQGWGRGSGRSGETRHGRPTAWPKQRESCFGDLRAYLAHLATFGRHRRKGRRASTR